MALKYRITEQSEIYFVTFTIINWIDIFTRDSYRDIFLGSIKHCQQNKGLQVYAWVIMTNHVHMIIGTNGDHPLQGIIRDLKSYTSRHIRLEIEQAAYESRKDWMMRMFRNAGIYNSNNNDFQLWVQDNHPIQLTNAEMFQQRLDYIHNNPVKAGFVTEPPHWKYSSAYDYCGGKQGLLDIILVF